MSRIAISPLVTQTRIIHANIACMPQALPHLRCTVLRPNPPAEFLSTRHPFTRHPFTRRPSVAASTSAPCSRMVSSPSVLRQQLTLLGSPESGFAAPAVHTPWPAVHNFIPLPPKRCERHSHLGLRCILSGLTPAEFHPPSVRDGEYFANNLRCWAHHLIPVQNSVLRHHAYAWCSHRRYFANNLRCWAYHLIPVQNSVLRHQLTLVSSPSVLRQQLTLLGSPRVLRLCAHAQSPQAYAWCPQRGNWSLSLLSGCKANCS